MKTSVETVSGVEKRIRVEIPADEVSRRVEEGYAEVRKMAPLRGFRKGKAPMSMVRRVFKESVEADVAERLVREFISGDNPCLESVLGALEENDLVPKILEMPHFLHQNGVPEMKIGSCRIKPCLDPQWFSPLEGTQEFHLQFLPGYQVYCPALYDLHLAFQFGFFIH